MLKRSAARFAILLAALYVLPGKQPLSASCPSTPGYWCSQTPLQEQAELWCNYYYSSSYSDICGYMVPEEEGCWQFAGFLCESFDPEASCSTQYDDSFGC